jgi:hypothetical protein
MENITIERLEQIEQERQEVIGDPAYQQWIRELNVSQSYSEPTGKLNARDMNNQYDYSNYKFVN